MLVIMCCLVSITKPLFAASSGWIDAFVVRLGDRIVKGPRTALHDALIAILVKDISIHA